MSILDIDQTRAAVFAGEIDPQLKMRFDYFADRDTGVRTTILPSDKGSRSVWDIIDSTETRLNQLGSPLSDEYTYRHSLRLLGDEGGPSYEDYMEGLTGCDRCGCDLSPLNQSLLAPCLCESCNRELDAEQDPVWSDKVDVI